MELEFLLDMKNTDKDYKTNGTDLEEVVQIYLIITVQEKQLTSWILCENSQARDGKE